MKKVLGLVLCVVLSVAPLGGCSVVMAMQGADNPNLAQVKAGVHKSSVDGLLGKPRGWVEEDRLATYRYTTGEESSPARAFGHGVMNVLTLLVWEVIGTPIEMLRDKTTWSLDVWYDPELRLERLEGPHRQ